MSKEVQQMFSSIAPRYDRANDVLSFGIHRLWRRRAVSLLDIHEGERALDLCTGTGDLALLLAERVGAGGLVHGLDFVPEMLSLAQRKEQGLRSTNPKIACAPINWIHGDAMNIPLPDSSVDCVTIAFGIRNVDNPKLCLEDIRRVLAPNGRLVVIEFGKPKLPIFSVLYQWYSDNLMPKIGGVITGNKAAYEYLPRTSKAFPCREMFLELMTRCGFQEVKMESLFGGIAYLYRGDKTASQKPVHNQANRQSGKPGRIAA